MRRALFSCGFLHLRWEYRFPGGLQTTECYYLIYSLKTPSKCLVENAFKGDKSALVENALRGITIEEASKAVQSGKHAGLDSGGTGREGGIWDTF